MKTPNKMTAGELWDTYHDFGRRNYEIFLEEYYVELEREAASRSLKLWDDNEIAPRPVEVILQDGGSVFAQPLAIKEGADPKFYSDGGVIRPYTITVGKLDASELYPQVLTVEVPEDAPEPKVTVSPEWVTFESGKHRVSLPVKWFRDSAWVFNSEDVLTLDFQAWKADVLGPMIY